jgi:hypothetical protein
MAKNKTKTGGLIPEYCAVWISISLKPTVKSPNSRENYKDPPPTPQQIPTKARSRSPSC